MDAEREGNQWIQQRLGEANNDDNKMLKDEEKEGNRAHQLYKIISMLFMFPVKEGKLSTGVNATFDASCYG